ncbi:MAG: hypothetical protein Q8S73_24480 [Deltaproteobacteria bacterium]|nr:hypothetical protein [Myxococcales bacterium]MDP3217291.1 hypothetical protein [Deltaproteobacteria bacterium]
MRHVALVAAGLCLAALAQRAARRPLVVVLGVAALLAVALHTGLALGASAALAAGYAGRR